MFTLAAVVFIASIFCFFSEEFLNMIKKIFAYKGAKLFLPLALASIFVDVFEGWLIWAIYYVQEVLLTMLAFISALVPFKFGAVSIGKIVFLTLMAIVPVIAVNLIMKKRSYKPYEHPYIISTFVWVICVLLVVVGVRSI